MAVQGRGGIRALNRGMPNPRNQDEPGGQPNRQGVYASQRLNLGGTGKTPRGKAKVRTGLGKSDRPGS